MANAAYTDTVQKVYIAYYGRAADPVGLAYWEDQLTANNGDLAAIMGSFGASAEATTLYGSLTNTAKVNALYQQSFGRDADFDGLMYYAGQLTAGTMTAVSIAQNIYDGASGSDATILTNKLVVAKAYTAAIDTAGEVVAYSGTVAAESARILLSTVDAATVTESFDVATSVASIVSTANGTVVPALTINLTTGTDTGAAATGTSGADQFNAFLGQSASSGSVANTLSSADSLDGGAGTDSLYAEILPEFFGTDATSATAHLDLQARTSSIENIQFEARETGVGATVTVDAKNMVDVVEIGSFQSDADLVIENLTTRSSNGTDRNTDVLTITMDHTDNFNSDNDASDLTVYLDEDYLLTGQTTGTSQANYWLLDQNSADYVTTPLDKIERTGVSFTITDVAYSVTMADTIAAAANDWSAFAAGLQTVITDLVAAGETALVGLTVAVDLTNTRSTFNDAGVRVTIPAITITDAAGRAIVPTGYTAPAVVSADFNIYGQFDDVASAVTANSLVINVDLHKVGRQGEGGNLLIGGKETDLDGGAADAGDGIGTFNIDVLGAATKLSNLGSINSTNNALTTVNIATHADSVAGATHASLTIRDAFNASTGMETVNAAAFKGDLNIGQDTRALNIDTFTATGGGKVTYNADISGTEKGVFATTTGAAADTINMTLDGDAVDTTGTSFAITSGGGADTITVAMTEGGVSVATTALLDNLSIASGSGADTVTLIGGSTGAADGDADFNIASGAGSDMVHINSVGDAGSVAASTGAWTAGDLDGTGATTFVDRVLYEAKLTVNFAGFEETVTVVTNSAGNFVATQLDINNAITAAVAANAELSKLLTIAKGTGSQQLAITSTVEGDNDLAISLFQDELVEFVAADPTTFAPGDLLAVQAGLMATTANNSDATDTTTEVIAILNGLDQFLTETGVAGVVYDVLGTADGVDGADETAVTSVSTIDMGTGANDLVVLNSHDGSANTLDFSAAWGKVSVVNFFTDQATAQANAAAIADNLTEGRHNIDFTAWLNDQTDPSATTGTLSAVSVATTSAVNGSAAITLSSNDVVIVNDFAGTTAESWAGLTAAELAAALNGTVAADDFANIGTHAGAAAPGDLVGTSISSIIMIENNLNAGEYKVFNAETSDLAGADTVAVTQLGTIDFGAEIDANANFTSVGVDGVVPVVVVPVVVVPVPVVVPVVGTNSPVNATTAAGALDASANNVTFGIAQANFTQTITGFAAGDVLDFTQSVTGVFSVTNTDFTDGNAQIQYSDGGTTAVISLTGLAAGMDTFNLTSSAGFDLMFGAGTIA